MSIFRVSAGGMILALALGCSHGQRNESDSKLLFPEEKHFKNIQQITAGGTNAEAYWSFDGTMLAFQHKAPEKSLEGPRCDQIYTMKADGSDRRLISGNLARTTCAYFYPDDSRVLYASTLSGGPDCPPNPDMSKGYVWPIFNTYQLYSAKPDGSDVFLMEPGAPRAYNAEATVCKNGSVIFTSDRDGDLDLYVGKLDSLGTLQGITRLTHGLGYDGGAFFSQDCSKIVWRASRPRAGLEAQSYTQYLKQHLVKPFELEIWMANSDGSHARQVTRIGAASFAPYFLPDGKRIIFASNPRNRHGRHFDLYLINVNGTGLERVSFSNTFESFPMFSPDGKRIAFSSNRNATEAHETNVFVADWVETPTTPFTVEDPDPANRIHALTAKLAAGESDALAKRYAALGFKPYLEVFPKTKGVAPQDVLGAWGAGCGKVAPVVLVASSLSGVSGMTEAAKILLDHAHAAKKACVVVAALPPGDPGAADRLWKTFRSAGKLPRLVLSLERIGGMENNLLTIAAQRPPKKLRSLLQEECGARHLTCRDEAAAGSFALPAAAPVPVFQFSAPGAEALEEMNITGVMQSAEVAAALALRILN